MCFKRMKGEKRMKKNKVVALFFVVCMAFVLSGCAAIRDFVAEDEVVEIRTFADWTDKDEFQTIPAMVVENTKIGSVEECGANIDMIDVSGTTLEDYKAYLELFEQSGFSKHSDNGENGLEGNVYTATFVKDELVVTVTQVIKSQKTYIIVGEEIPLSDRMTYSEDMIADNVSGAKTTLHMLELYDFGSSFLIQLKNGHFIMNDGGMEEDLPVLIDYMESLVPEGEKPIIDAWFISHAHGDHINCFGAFTDNPSYAKRIIVESVYFNEPGNQSNLATKGSSLVMNFMIDYKFLKNSEGLSPALYTPMTGQRYYFSDVTVDVVFSQELLPVANYGGATLNTTSTWLMYTIEGQKLLIPGDGCYANMTAIMHAYEQEYFNVDMFVVAHHGINVYDYFTDYLNYTTAIYPVYRIGSLKSEGDLARETQNAHLVSRAKEVVSWGDGTKIFTFPYQVGDVVSLPVIDWSARNVVIDRSNVRIENYQTYIVNE